MSAALQGPEFESDPIEAILESVAEDVKAAILTELTKVYDAIPEQMVAEGPEVYLGGILLPFHMKNLFKLTQSDRDVLLETLGLRLEESGTFFNLYATVNSPKPEDNSKAKLLKLLRPTPRK